MKRPTPNAQRPTRNVASGFSRKLLVIVAILIAAPAQAQTPVGIRGFADVGSRTFTATDSVTAILGTDRGVVFGGGAEVLLPWHVFAGLRASRFRATGERVFLFEGEQFDLGIPTTVTVTPIELTGGYRFEFWRRFVPYAGLGIGWHTYTETSEFATDSENVEMRRTGFQLMGGAEVGLMRWLAAAGELQWATVPDALGDDPNGVASAFEEDNLGGVTFRVKIVVGR